MGTVAGIIMGIIIGAIIGYFLFDVNSPIHSSLINNSSQTSISDLLANPNNFTNKTVSVSGQFQIGCSGYYNLGLLDVNTGKSICIDASLDLANAWNNKAVTVVGTISTFHYYAGASNLTDVVIKLERIS